MDVERADALRDERGRDARVEVVGQRLGAAVARRLEPEIRELLALEHPGPGVLTRHGSTLAFDRPGCPDRG